MTLKLGERFPDSVFAALAAAGHDVERLPAYSDTASHAGVISLLPSSVLEGANEPRNDGAALIF